MACLSNVHVCKVLFKTLLQKQIFKASLFLLSSMNISHFCFFVDLISFTNSGLFLLFLQCSIQPCDSVEWSNEQDVNNFKDEYGQVGFEYTCYYNPKTPDEAFQERSSVKSDEMKVLHCILWPMLLIAISVGLLGTLLCRSKGFLCFKKNNGSSVPYQNMQPTA